ncbi:Endonuclease/exonuclease/phosphatase [Sporodiniella umbellata]|nr:Endonuclease/exonuclease/phosphatase [Sporodiniella umbellata]
MTTTVETAAKKVKTTAPKKGAWEPFDPSIPNNTTFPTSLNFPPQADNTLKLASYNVASLAASIKKGFLKYVKAENPDILCIQETKMNQKPISSVSKEDYPYQYWSFSDKKGYAGVAVFSKREPKSVSYELPGNSEKGRVITLQFEKTVFISSYVPNAGDKLVRLNERRVFNQAMEDHIRGFQKESKSVIWAGDLNVAHTAMDLARPETNERSAGFTIEERTDMTKILTEKEGQPALIDTWRHLHPEQKGHYTYYSYRFKCREKRMGWRLDYFIITPDLLDRLVESDIRHEVWGASDHVPIIMTLKEKDL